MIRNSLEFVVFEKQISDEYGSWRMHDKIVPEWAQSDVRVQRTFRKPKVSEDDLELKRRHDEKVKDVKKPDQSSKADSDQPQPAAA